MCKQILKSHLPKLRRGLSWEWGLVPAKCRVAWLGIEGVGYTAALRAEGLVHGWGPGREVLNTMSARSFCRQGRELLVGRAMSFRFAVPSWCPRIGPGTQRCSIPIGWMNG